jgi:hypothetical protein
MVFSGLASKLVARVSRFVSQNRQLRFGDLCLKITVMVFWFGSQNQADFGLSDAPQNRRREDDVGYALRSSSLLHLEASHAMVFQSGLKIGAGATTDGVRSTIVEVASGTN